MRRMVLLALAATAWADGGFVSKKVPVVEIPDQQAILVWQEGRERLVIDTAHTGGGDLAWIVPLPAPPRIEPVSPAVFRTIEVVTMPVIEEAPGDGWKLGLYVLAAVAVMSLIPARFENVRGITLLLLILFGLLIGVSVLVPRSGLPISRVAVLDRGTAGEYETATLQSVDADALLGWLDENGFKVAPGVRTGIEEYVRDGWVFAVARLKAGGSGGRAHPLSFEFDAKEPVYPMRLTGTQDRALSLRLFVFADRRARCDAIGTDSCYRVAPAEDTYFAPRQEYREEREIGQPELHRIAADATVLTTLRGDLEAGALRKDLRLTFEDYAPLVPTFYSDAAARTGAAGTALWLALILLIPCHLVAWVFQRLRAGKDWHDDMSRAAFRVGWRGKVIAWCVAIGIGLFAGATDYLTRDTTFRMRGDEGDMPGTMVLHSYHRQGVGIVDQLATSDVEVARAAAQDIWRGQRNLYDGLPVREEASPGNYGFEVREGRVAYVYYDARGMAIRE